MGAIRGGGLAAGWGGELIARTGGLSSCGGIRREGLAVLEAVDGLEDGGLGGRSCWGGRGGLKWTTGPLGLAAAGVGDLERSVDEPSRIWTFVGEPTGIGSGADRLSPCFAFC